MTDFWLCLLETQVTGEEGGGGDVGWEARVLHYLVDSNINIVKYVSRLVVLDISYLASSV